MSSIIKAGTRANLKSLSEYCASVDGTTNKYGDVVSKKTGKLICPDRVVNTLSMAYVANGGKSGCPCYVHGAKNIARIQFINKDSGKPYGNYWDAPIDALYYEF